MIIKMYTDILGSWANAVTLCQHKDSEQGGHQERNKGRNHRDSTICDYIVCVCVCVRVCMCVCVWRGRFGFDT